MDLGQKILFSYPSNDKRQRHPFKPRNAGNVLHSMDCTDIVIGTSKTIGSGTSMKSLHRVYDAYTRDRSTPKRDDFYGGKEDLTGAFAYEDAEGFTVVAFQRKLESSDPTDHTLSKGLTHIIWAYGQGKGELLSQSPQSKSIIFHQ